IASAGLIVFVRILSNILIDSNTYPEYATAFLYTPVLIVGVLMMCFNQFLSSVYSATQHTTHSFWTSLVAAIVNIVLNIILIHIWGIMGAAIATFASYFVCYCIRIVDARKYVPFPVNHAKFAANTAALFLLGIVVVEAPPMDFDSGCGICLYGAVQLQRCHPDTGTASPQKITAIPHKERLATLHAICLQIFLQSLFRIFRTHLACIFSEIFRENTRKSTKDFSVFPFISQNLTTQSAYVRYEQLSYFTKCS
ncbi:MAG: lipopolysaccharide biosynthesis protein, partial [Ruminococcus callidus]